MWHGIIMAGGSGTRFWPLSRELYPKQFLALAGEKSLLHGTVNRILPLLPPEQIWVMVGTKHEGETKRILQTLSPKAPGEASPRIFIEPQSRNTLPPLTLASAFILASDPDGVLCVMASDHLITPEEKFLALIKQACLTVEKNDVLLTFGIPPKRPETGFGYIEKGDPVETEQFGQAQTFTVRRFVEKPHRALAEQFVNDHSHFWNSGMFVFRASVFLEEVRKYQPLLYALAKDLMSAIGTPGEEEAVKTFYAAAPNISVDYAIMEHSTCVWTMKSDIDWKDVGSFNALDDISDHDEKGNVIRGNVIAIDSQDSIIFGDKRVIATIGVKDLVIVDTDDATLISHKDDVQKVREVVAELKGKKRVEALEHRTTHRPWGHYTVLDQGPHYKIKRVTVNPDARLSLQMHLHRSEHWVVTTGTARVTLDDNEVYLHVNQSIDIPKTVRHRVHNPGKVPLVIIEVQNGEYLEEDDIIRFQDDYNRIKDPKHEGHSC